MQLFILGSSVNPVLDPLSHFSREVGIKGSIVTKDVSKLLEEAGSFSSAVVVIGKDV